MKSHTHRDVIASGHQDHLTVQHLGRRSNWRQQSSPILCSCAVVHIQCQIANGTYRQPEGRGCDSFICDGTPAASNIATIKTCLAFASDAYCRLLRLRQRESPTLQMNKGTQPGPIHTSWMPLRLCLRKLAKVLKSGASSPVSNMTSTLRPASRSRVRLERRPLR